MNKYITILCIALASCLSACQDEWGANNGTAQRNPEEGLSVTFITESLPPMKSEGDATSRANDPYKQAFEDGDRLHVSATFTLLGANGEPDASKTVSKYALLQFNEANDEWQAVENTQMTWPYNAAYATFTAYYIDDSEGLLLTTSPKTVVLQEITDVTDPLKAVTEEPVPYGNAVHLVFQHLCAKLTLTNLSSDAIEFWAKTDEENNADPIKNQFQLLLARDDAGNETIPDENQFTSTGENAHIAAQRTADNTLTFYLAPGDYYGMKLNYRYDRPYRGLNIEGLRDLKAGTSYVIDFTQHHGSIIIEDDDNGEEDPEKDPDHVNMETTDIDDFLEAIHDGTEYKQGDQIVLAADGNGATTLLVNVDFQGNSFTGIDLPSTASFDGNGHYIQNVARPLFDDINGGKIANLGIYNEEGIVIKENEDPATNANAVGAVARTCQIAADDPDKANIDNVRLGGIVISAKPPQNSDLIFNVWAAVGNCQGRINNIRFAGNIKVEVATTETKREIGTVNVGGVIGQLTSSGHLSQVARMEEETPGTLTVISSCPNTTNDRNTGGLVGLSNGRIEDCTLTHTTVDASNTCGTMVYTGGLAGMARGTQGSHETTTNGIFRCKFDGTIKCGLAYSEDHGDDSAEGHAYAGGAVGYAYWVDGIEENEISGTLYEPSDDSATGGFKPYENSIYATGGLFGQAFESPTSNNTTWINFENVYEGTSPNYFKGKIAGRADANSTAESNQSYTPGELENIGDEITSGDLPGEN